MLNLLNDNIVIKTVTDSSNAIGGTNETLSTFATVQAYVQPLGSEERELYGRQTLIDQRKVYIKALSGLTSRKKVTWNSRDWDIIGLQNFTDVHSATQYMKIIMEERS